MTTVVMKKNDEARAVFERLADSFPESVDALRALGDGYDTLGDFEKAEYYYGLALAKAEKGPHMNLPSTRETVKRFKRKMEAQKKE